MLALGLLPGVVRLLLAILPVLAAMVHTQVSLEIWMPMLACTSAEFACVDFAIPPHHAVNAEIFQNLC